MEFFFQSYEYARSDRSMGHGDHCGSALENGINSGPEQATLLRELRKPFQHNHGGNLELRQARVRWLQAKSGTNQQTSERSGAK